VNTKVRGIEEVIKTIEVLSQWCDGEKNVELDGKVVEGFMILTVAGSGDAPRRIGACAGGLNLLECLALLENAKDNTIRTIFNELKGDIDGKDE